MPRLLLVDDNPSIHKIAETLLGPTSVELVCVDSAEAALAKFEEGERFDVALIDTAMPDMDGWTLLAKLRRDPATALLPIAMMAGVLDVVDQAQVDAAPIQGFLKKPIELRELGDRIQQILTMPVEPPETAPEPTPEAAAFATVPGAPLSALVHPLPETRAEEGVMDVADDLLILEEQDLYPAEPAGLAPVEAPVSDSLELEELDLESLGALEAPMAEASAPQPPTSQPEPTPATLADLEPTWEEVPAPVEEPTPAAAMEEMPDLGADFDLEDLPMAPVPVPEAAAPAHVEAPTMAPLEIPMPAAVPVAAGEGAALVQALLADPAALDALARALVERLGDQTLREIAWEIMPDLAEKLRK